MYGKSVSPLELLLITVVLFYFNPSRSKEFYNLVRPRGGGSRGGGGKITPQRKIAITSLVLKIS